MIFTTVKKKKEVTEKYPSLPVLTLLGKTSDKEKGAKVAFHLNSLAMSLMGFPMNTPNISKIANGFDEDNNLVLAAMDTEDMYTSNITAKNTFNSQKLYERICGIYPQVEGYTAEFELVVTEVDGVKYAHVYPLVTAEDCEDCEVIGVTGADNEEEALPEDVIEEPQATTSTPLPQVPPAISTAQLW